MSSTTPSREEALRALEFIQDIWQMAPDLPYTKTLRAFIERSAPDAAPAAPITAMADTLALTDAALDRIISTAVEADHHSAEDDQTRASEIRHTLRAMIASALKTECPPADHRRISDLLARLPSLDPSWPDPVRDGWVRCFNALRTLAPPPGGEADERADLTKLATECGATVYRNRASPQQPAVAFGDESWARFCSALASSPKEGQATSERKDHV